MKKILLLLMMMVSASFSQFAPTYILYNSIYYVRSYIEIEHKDYSSQLPASTYSNYYIPSSTNPNLTIYEIDSTENLGTFIESGTTYYFYMRRQVVYIPKTSIDCPNGTISNGECVAPPAPTCTSNEQLNTSTQKCECKPGYKRDYTGADDNNLEPLNTCSPKRNCPPQMKYFWTDQATDITGLFKTEYYTCVPRTDLNEADCSSQGGTYYKKSMMGESLQDYYTSYILKNGEGCVNEQWVKDEAFALDFSFLMSGFILGGTRPFPESLVGKAVDEKQLLLTYKNAGNDADLLTYKPEVTDLTMGADGVYADLGLIVNDTSLDAKTASAYNQWLKDNGYITDTSEVSSTPVNNLGVNSNVSSKIDDLFYKGGDELDFKDNMLGTANMNISGAMPDLSSASSASIGTTVATKIDLNAHLLGTEVKSYPVSLVKQVEKTNADGSVSSSYKGTVTFPDSTVADFTVNSIRQTSGALVNEVGYSYIVDTKTGTKTFNGSYTTTTDSTGTVTNTVSKPSTITTVNDDGSVSTSTNAGSSSVTTDQTDTAVNLSPITQRLDQIKSKLDAIQQEQVKQWEYTSPKTAEATASLTKLTQAFTDYSLSLDNLFNFADGLFSDLKNLLQAFDDAKNQFTDKPTVSIPTGTCPFTISGANRTGGPIKTYTIDPCYFVAPRKPFLTVFFTLLFSWMVVMFAIKHLFNTTPNS